MACLNQDSDTQYWHGGLWDVVLYRKQHFLKLYRKKHLCHI